MLIEALKFAYKKVHENASYLLLVGFLIVLAQYLLFLLPLTPTGKFLAFLLNPFVTALALSMIASVAFNKKPFFEDVLVLLLTSSMLSYIAYAIPFFVGNPVIIFVVALVLFVANVLLNYLALKAALGEKVKLDTKTLGNAFIVFLYMIAINIITVLAAFIVAFVLFAIGSLSKAAMFFAAFATLIIVTLLVVMGYTAVLYVADKY